MMNLKNLLKNFWITWNRRVIVSNCVAFLASEMSDYINGETIHVNGGMYMS